MRLTLFFTNALLVLILLVLGLIYWQSSYGGSYSLIYTSASGSDYVQDYDLSYSDCIHKTWDDPRWRCTEQ